MTIQYLIVIIILIAAVGYLAVRAYRALTQKEGPCDGCDGCKLKEHCTKTNQTKVGQNSENNSAKHKK